MATFKFKGLDEYVRKLESLTKSTDGIIGTAVYEGAKIVADEYKRAIEDIPIDDRRWAEHKTGIRSIEKWGLVYGFGIAKLTNDDGFINVKLGFDGYNELGTANAMIARTVESGTYFMPKFQTFTKASNKAKKACEEKMKIVIEKAIANKLEEK